MGRMCSVTRREQDVRCCRNVDRQEMCTAAVNTCTPSVCRCKSCVLTDTGGVVEPGSVGRMCTGAVTKILR